MMIYFPFIDGFSTINHPFWGTPQLWKPRNNLNYLNLLMDQDGFFKWNFLCAVWINLRVFPSIPVKFAGFPSAPRPVLGRCRWIFFVSAWAEDVRAQRFSDPCFVNIHNLHNTYIYNYVYVYRYRYIQPIVCTYIYIYICIGIIWYIYIYTYHPL